MALHTAVAQDSTATRHSQPAQSAQQEYYQRNQRTQNAPMEVVRRTRRNEANYLRRCDFS